MSSGHESRTIAVPSRSPVSRRRFLAGAGSGVAVALLRAPSALAAKPSQLVCVLESDPPVINPAITNSIASFVAGCPVYNGLVYVNTKYEVEPELAERWEASPDNKKYTFYLRKGVTWHDGAPFTSADVKFSIENINSKFQPYGRAGFKQLDRVETPDEHTAIIYMKAPSPAVLATGDRASGSILPKHLWQGQNVTSSPLNQKPVGTGPFKLVEYRRGEVIRYVKNERYFVRGKPAIDELIFRIIPDAAGRVAAFESGEADVLYAYAVPPVEAVRLAKMRGVTLKTTDARGGAYLAMFNTRRKPCNDARVRQAIAHAIDRKFMRENIVQGYTENMVGPLPPVSPLYNKNLKDYAFDPKQANQMLDAAGFPRGSDGRRFAIALLWPNYDDNVSKIADVIQRNLGEVGIRVNFQPLDRGALNQRGYTALEFDMIIESYGLGPDPDIGVERLYNSNNILTPPQPFTNSSGYSNPVVDRMFEEQRAQPDLASRRKVYDRIQETIWRDLPVLPMFAYLQVNIFRSSYVTDIFNTPASNYENFADAKLV